MAFVTSYDTPVDFSVGAESEEKLLAFREELNRRIAQAIKA